MQVEEEEDLDTKAHLLKSKRVEQGEQTWEEKEVLGRIVMVSPEAVIQEEPEQTVVEGVAVQEAVQVVVEAQTVFIVEEEGEAMVVAVVL
jgi:hypothetical protein